MALKMHCDDVAQMMARVAPLVEKKVVQLARMNAAQVAQQVARLVAREKQMTMNAHDAQLEVARMDHEMKMNRMTHTKKS